MITLGLRLTFAGGRAVIARLVLIAAAVTLGVAMLLATLSALNAVNTQNQRFAWLETGSAGPSADGGSASFWLRLVGDRFGDQLIGRVDVSAITADPPAPPGISTLPAPGEFYASPAMVALLRATPRPELAARYPGHLVGTIDAAGLPSPDSLIIIIGRTPADIQRGIGAQRISAWSTTSPSDCAGCAPGIGFNANGIDLLLGVVTLALLFPTMVFIGAATRLSAARREQRFAAMRLVGATPAQVSVIAAVESIVATVVGVAGGFALFFLARPAVATIPFTGSRFYESDLSLSVVDIAAVIIGVPVAAATAARFALRRVQISPLGVTRRVTPPQPRAWRLLPLLGGLAELTWFAFAGRPAGTGNQFLVYLGGVLTVMVGLVLAGPWLTRAGSRLLIGRTKRPDMLIAGRRLSDNPHAGFRAVSGLVLALFIGSVALGILTTYTANRGITELSSAADRTFDEEFISFPANASEPQVTVPSVPPSALANLRAIPGVLGLALVHRDPRLGRDVLFGPGLVTCADLARLGSWGRCSSGAGAAKVELGARRNSEDASSIVDRRWPVARLSAAAVSALPVQDLLVATDGSRAAVERVRTALEFLHPSFYTPTTTGEANVDSARLTLAYQRLGDVVILASLPIAGCSLAVGAVSGLSERRRAFSSLRLSGAPLAMLRRVVALENVVPILAGSLVSIALGFLTAHLFLESQLGYSLVAPTLGYYVAVIGGIAGALAIVGSTLPFLKRVTGPEASRND